MIGKTQKKQFIKTRRDVARKVENINLSNIDELFEKAAADFLTNKEVLNDLVISLAARLQRDYNYSMESLTRVFDDANHEGPHDLAAVLLLLKELNDCQDADAESYSERQQQWRESEARI